MTEIDVARHSLLIDPHLHIWGWEIPIYLFLGGMAAGLMVLASLLALRPSERSPAARWLGLAAPAVVSIGMGALLLDLALKEHVFRFYLAFRPSSPMSWGAWILAAVYPATLLVGLAGLDEAQAEKAASLAGRVGLGGVVRALRESGLRHRPRLLWANLSIGICLGVYTGVLLSTLGARAFWNSALLGPLFLVSGLSTGAALMLLFPLSPAERHLVTRWDLLAIGIEGLLLALFLVGLATSGAEGKEAAALVLGGRYTGVFWALVVFAGLVVPWALEAFETRMRLAATAVAPALVLLGGLALRWILVAGGQA